MYNNEKQHLFGFIIRYIYSFFSFRQDRTNIIIVVEPVGLIGNMDYEAATGCAGFAKSASPKRQSAEMGHQYDPLSYLP